MSALGFGTRCSRPVVVDLLHPEGEPTCVCPLVSRSTAPPSPQPTSAGAGPARVGLEADGGHRNATTGASVLPIHTPDSTRAGRLPVHHPRPNQRMEEEINTRSLGVYDAVETNVPLRPPLDHETSSITSQLWHESWLYHSTVCHNVTEYTVIGSMLPFEMSSFIVTQM